MTAAPSSPTTSGLLPESRTAVVTGAGGPAGIGRVTARLLAENGWHVALIDINADGLAAVEAELREAGHSDLLAVPTNIASESSVAEAFERIDSELPPVVGLVNLAGIASQATLHECELEQFERVMAVNVTGSYLMLKAAAARSVATFGRGPTTTASMAERDSWPKSWPTRPWMLVRWAMSRRPRASALQSRSSSEEYSS